MPPRSLTVLVPVRPEKAARLRAVLRAIGDDINGKDLQAGRVRPHIEFGRSRRIHFARFSILNDPDRGPGRVRLLFASIYDGSLDAHLNGLVSITSDMEAIWASCEGYPGVAGFASFIRTHAQEPAAYYIGFRDETVESITRAIAARRQRHALQDGSPSGRSGGAGTASTGAGGSLDPSHSVLGALTRVVRAAPIVSDVFRAIAICGFGNVYFGSRRIIASLDRYAVFRVINRITRNRIPPLQSRYSGVALEQNGPFVPLAAGDEIPFDPAAAAPSFREDAVTQNQLTVVTVIDPASIDRVRAVMAAIDSYARRLSPRGSLIGISTIHFVRWLLIDNGRRLVLVSDYDGTWENYIDEFAEMIVSGLDAIWETALGVPADGARDLPGFKRFLRSHQVPAEIFFAAYPDATMLNIASDLAAEPRH